MALPLLLAPFFLARVAIPATSHPDAIVGFATSDKQIRVNGHLEHGNVTLFEGDAVQSEDAMCRIHVKSGAGLSIANKSRVHLSAGNIDLDEGAARIYGYAAQGYSTRVRGLVVRADQSASGIVSIAGRTVEVTALTGGLHVLNGQGTVVANLTAGQSLSLDPSARVKSDAYSLTGCVVKSGDGLFLTDVTAGVTVELRGIKVPSGKVVNVTGSAIPDAHPAAQVTQAIRVESFHPAPGSCRQVSRAGSAAAAGAIAGTAAVGAGASLAAVGAGAVAGGAVVAGVAASTSHSGSGVTNMNPPVTIPNCVSPCYLH